MISADLVVVGAGSAGCLVAAHLARDPTRRVLLLERGPLAPPGPDVTALTRLPIEPGGERTRRTAEARGRDVVRGSGIGGSSVVNGGYFLRGHRDDYGAWPYPTAEIEGAFTRVEAAMRAAPFADTDLGAVPSAFERHWQARVPRAIGPWPGVGLNRVRSNHNGVRRRTAAEAFLPGAAGAPGAGDTAGATGRPGTAGPRLVRAEALRLVTAGGRVTGVITDRGRIAAGEVVLAAGTLGSAALLCPLLGPLPVYEHAETLVRFAPRVPIAPAPLLQTVVHTPDGLEIRCYSGDFAAYIGGLPPGGVCIGVADMGRPSAGSVRQGGPGAGGIQLDLGDPDATSRARMAAGVRDVVEMLSSPAFASLVEPGSVTIDGLPGMSSHAWGTVPLGTATGLDGALAGTVGLRVVDGSVLPGALRSGPHASVLMTADVIARRIAT